MASLHRYVDFQSALQDPASAFANPDDVLQLGHLTRPQKIEILRRWEFDSRELEVAEEENMTGGAGPSRLSAVRKALIALGAGDGNGPSAPTKQGGG